MDNHDCNCQIRPVLPPLKRIALLSVHTSPLATPGKRKTGGMNVMVRAIATTLGRRGIQVDVFTRADAPERAGQVVEMGPNARLIYLSAGPLHPLDPDAIYPHVLDFVAALLKFTNANDLHYDLIYSHYWISGAVALPLREAWDIPIVQMFHTLGQMKQRIADTRSDSSPSSRIPASPNRRVAVESQVMRSAERLIAATHAERVQMLMLYRADRRRIEVVPPGVDLKQFYPTDRATARQRAGLAGGEKMLLFVGRIEPLKGIDIIVEALAHLRAKRPGLVSGLTINVVGGDLAGDSPDNAEMRYLQELSASHDLEDVVQFIGARGQDELLYYYNAAEALVIPSDYESFGMVALEAMACGTPVIASEVGGLAFLVKDGETGFHVPTREPPALAARIQTLLENPQQRAAMGQAARQLARQYDWQRIADKLIEIFMDATLDRHPRYSIS